MPIIRKLRSYFFGPSGSAGTKFSRENIPTEARYRELFGSILFPMESDDTAKESEAGHVKISTDDHAIAKNDNTGDGHKRTILPHQLPGVAAYDGTEGSLLAIPEQKGISIEGVEKSLGGGLKRLIYKIYAKVSKSVVFDNDEAISLDGDETTPTDGKFYGKLNGSKGWFDPISDTNALPYTGVDSVVVDNAAKEITLDGDETTPTDEKFYGMRSGAKGWYAPLTDPRLLIAVNTTEWNMSVGPTLEALYAITVVPATHLPTTGSKIITRWCVTREALTPGSRRYFDLRIGTGSYGGANNERLLYDQYSAAEENEESYLITAEITNAGANNYLVYSYIETLSTMPTETQVKSNEILPITLPSTSYITCWAGVDTMAGGMTVNWCEAYYYIA